MGQECEEHHFFDGDLRGDIPPDEQFAIPLEKDAVRNARDVPREKKRDGENDDENRATSIDEQCELPAAVKQDRPDEGKDE